MQIPARCHNAAASAAAAAASLVLATLGARRAKINRYSALSCVRSALRELPPCPTKHAYTRTRTQLHASRQWPCRQAHGTSTCTSACAGALAQPRHHLTSFSMSEVRSSDGRHLERSIVAPLGLGGASPVAFMAAASARQCCLYVATHRTSDMKEMMLFSEGR